MTKDEQRAFQVLTRLVGIRPRTESEMSRRLTEKGFAPEVAERAIAQGRRAGLLDDRLFARLYAEDRLMSRPCARRLLAQELSNKGIHRQLAQEAASNALPEVDEQELAERALAGGAHLWDRVSPDVARRRAAAFLLRRGFTPGVARKVVDQRYKER